MIAPAFSTASTRCPSARWAWPAVVRCRRWPSSLPTGQRLDARDLIVAVGDLPVDGDRRQVTPDPARGDPPLQVVLGVETRDLARVGVCLPIQDLS